MQLVGNTILITGGGSGIGLELARQLSPRNTVILCGRRPAALQSAARAMPGVVWRACDITEPAQRESLVAWLRTEYGALNVLVNNAGIQRQVDFSATVDATAVDAEIATNFLSPVLLTALHSWSMSLRWQLARLGIRVVELVPPIVASELADDARVAREASPEGPPVMATEAFVSEALRRIEAGEDEIAVGIAQMLRDRRDAAFAMIND